MEEFKISKEDLMSVFAPTDIAITLLQLMSVFGVEEVSVQKINDRYFTEIKNVEVSFCGSLVKAVIEEEVHYFDMLDSNPEEQIKKLLK